MTNKHKKVPELRFKGFTDDWEQRKLGDVIIVNSGKDYKHLNKGEIPVYGTGGYMLGVDQALSYNKDAIGIGRKGTIDNPYILKAPFWTVDTLFYAIPLLGYNLNFIYNIFQIINWKRYDESTGVPSLSKTVINGIIVSIPNNTEQYQIGNFFKQIDDTIALHQRKLDLLKEQKKGFLQKMFPKNGETVPELRFEGFAEAWEQRKFGDVWAKSSERNTNLEYSPDKVISVAQMKLNPSERDSTDEYMKTYNILHKGDIAFEGNKSKHFAFGRFVLNDIQDGIVSHVFNVYRPKVEMDIDFMKIYINNENVMRHILVRATTKTLMMTTLNTKDIVKQHLHIPMIQEQKKIGKLFSNLDHLITLHQRSLVF